MRKSREGEDVFFLKKTFRRTIVATDVTRNDFMRTLAQQNRRRPLTSMMRCERLGINSYCAFPQKEIA